MVGFMLWMGSAITVAFIASAPTETPQASRAALRRTTRWLIGPSMLVAFTGGLAMLLPNFGSVYSKAGWMHGKLFILLLLAGLTGALTGKLRRSADGSKDVPARDFLRIGIVMLVLAVIVISLAVLRPGS